MDFLTVVGVVLGLLGLYALLNVPRQVRLHDRLMENRNDNLSKWIDDADSDLGTELARITNQQVSASARHVEYPMYLRVGTRQRAKNEVVERLTDRAREAKQYRDQIELSEGGNTSCGGASGPSRFPNSPRWTRRRM